MFFISVLIKKLQFLLHTHSQVRAGDLENGLCVVVGLEKRRRYRGLKIFSFLCFSFETRPSRQRRRRRWWEWDIAGGIVCATVARLLRSLGSSWDSFCAVILLQSFRPRSTHLLSLWFTISSCFFLFLDIALHCISLVCCMHENAVFSFCTRRFFFGWQKTSSFLPSSLLTKFSSVCVALSHILRPLMWMGGNYYCDRGPRLNSMHIRWLFSRVQTTDEWEIASVCEDFGAVALMQTVDALHFLHDSKSQGQYSLSRLFFSFTFNTSRWLESCVAISIS